jgi:hypothetical protein
MKRVQLIVIVVPLLIAVARDIALMKWYAKGIKSVEIIVITILNVYQNSALITNAKLTRYSYLNGH